MNYLQILCQCNSPEPEEVILTQNTSSSDPEIRPTKKKFSGGFICKKCQHVISIKDAKVNISLRLLC